MIKLSKFLDNGLPLLSFIIGYLVLAGTFLLFFSWIKWWIIPGITILGLILATGTSWKANRNWWRLLAAQWNLIAFCWWASFNYPSRGGHWGAGNQILEIWYVLLTTIAYVFVLRFILDAYNMVREKPISFPMALCLLASGLSVLKAGFSLFQTLCVISYWVG